MRHHRQAYLIFIILFTLLSTTHCGLAIPTTNLRSSSSSNITQANSTISPNIFNFALIPNSQFFTSQRAEILQIIRNNSNTIFNLAYFNRSSPNGSNIYEFTEGGNWLYMGGTK